MIEIKFFISILFFSEQKSRNSDTALSLHNGPTNFDYLFQITEPETNAIVILLRTELYLLPIIYNPIFWPFMLLWCFTLSIALRCHCEIHLCDSTERETERNTGIYNRNCVKRSKFLRQTYENPKPFANFTTDPSEVAFGSKRIANEFYLGTWEHQTIYSDLDFRAASSQLYKLMVRFLLSPCVFAVVLLCKFVHPFASFCLLSQSHTITPASHATREQICAAPQSFSNREFCTVALPFPGAAPTNKNRDSKTFSRGEHPALAV